MQQAKKQQHRIGLSLSGGGYRAAAFHLGTLKKLHEMRILDRLDVLSTVSGGSIIGACYCLNKTGFAAFEQNLKEKLCTLSVIRFILSSRLFLRIALPIFSLLVLSIGTLFTNVPWLSALILVGLVVLIVRYQFRLFPVSQVIEQAYDRFFYNGATLQSLSDKPELAIASTNLSTCRPFTFSKRKMGDSTYEFDMGKPIRFVSHTFPVARAVMASSCVPHAFSPVFVAREFYQDSTDFDRVKPVLIDGGVYDNQGIQKLTQRGSSYACDIIITSDAGNKLPLEGVYNNVLSLLIRTVDTFMARIKNVQMSNHLYESAYKGRRQVAYLSLGWDLAASIPLFVGSLKKGFIPNAVIEAHNIPQNWLDDIGQHEKAIGDQLRRNTDYARILAQNLTEAELSIARGVSTNLCKLTIVEVDCLMRHAANLTELQVRLYCPALLNE